VALHTEVANASVDAGGIDSALTLMLSDPGYTQTRPRVLLWESPDIYSFNMPVLWRQVIPALAGACSEADALASSRVPLAATTPLLSNISAPVTGGKDYLYLHSDSAALTSFTLTLTYADGQQEKVEMERTTRAPNHGHYYLELNPAYSTTLTAVSLSAPAPASGQITTRLCRGH
jgi:alginate biosynthesis protein AlgX